MPPDEVNEIAGQITDATVHLVDVNLDLVRRMAGNLSDGSGAEDNCGPAEEAWMTWTESAGDLVQISYLTAQLVDAMWGRRRPPPGSP